MDLAQGVKLMLTLAQERYPDKRYDTWARRYCLGIDKTEASWIKAQSDFDKKSKWNDVHCNMLVWFELNDPNRPQKSKDYLKVSLERYLADFFRQEKIPVEHYNR